MRHEAGPATAPAAGSGARPGRRGMIVPFRVAPCACRVSPQRAAECKSFGPLRHGGDREADGAEGRARSARRDRAADPAGAGRDAGGARRGRSSRSRCCAPARASSWRPKTARSTASCRGSAANGCGSSPTATNPLSVIAQRAHHRQPGRHRAGRSRARGRGRRLAQRRRAEEARRRLAGAQLRDRRSAASARATSPIRARCSPATA